MKLGISLYCLKGAIVANQMTVLEAIDWIAEAGAAHVEIVPVSFDLLEQPELADAIRDRARQAGIDVSNYCVSANFVTADAAEYERMIERVKRHVDVTARLGAKRMRHDVASRPIGDISLRNFQRDLPRLVEACRTIADYAAGYGITTSVENHGYYMQASERVQQLIVEVDRDNYRATLDIGNFLCVDEQPLIAVQRNIHLASMIHLKDFYVRTPDRSPGLSCPGWIPTAGGNQLRGAILGQGDIHIRDVLRVIKHAGYDGYLSLEFEGMEECRNATKLGFSYAKRVWEEL
ncbi:sugar phosphate isomerase/epimerase [Paenibacillus hemerocallicola]|uniref:Sugar phosphate isomerase/epimerase n=1 Tax=Paenibacillus hemerocallicola TaxID=1172614 RepID=A0A5C4TA74_9BACL|nr:sugar phosphate isomerase/epimerase family protein [Paenibacillus hemerocallicola]TNJ65948.1 sugar phosphate isomerase/epimerase [Paenibacillus hemerocallicola]